MGPDMVIVLASLPHDDLGFLKTIEISSSRIIPKGAIKAFTKAIFPRTAWFYVSSFDINTQKATDVALFSDKLRPIV
jgi:hypothetical protein